MTTIEASVISAGKIRSPEMEEETFLSQTTFAEFDQALVAVNIANNACENMPRILIEQLKSISYDEVSLELLASLLVPEKISICAVWTKVVENKLLIKKLEIGPFYLFLKNKQGLTVFPKDPTYVVKAEYAQSELEAPAVYNSFLHQQKLNVINLSDPDECYFYFGGEEEAAHQCQSIRSGIANFWSEYSFDDAADSSLILTNQDGLEKLGIKQIEKLSFEELEMAALKEEETIDSRIFPFSFGMATRRNKDYQDRLFAQFLKLNVLISKVEESPDFQTFSAVNRTLKHFRFETYEDILLVKMNFKGF